MLKILHVQSKCKLPLPTAAKLGKAMRKLVSGVEDKVQILSLLRIIKES